MVLMNRFTKFGEPVHQGWKDGIVVDIGLSSHRYQNYYLIEKICSGRERLEARQKENAEQEKQ